MSEQTQEPEIYEFTIASHFLYNLEYGFEEGGCDTDEDKEFVKAFEDQLNAKKEQLGYSSYHYGYDTEQESYYDRCDICGLFAEVIDIQVVFMFPKEQLSE